MRHLIIILCLLLPVCRGWGKTVRDTLTTRQNDRIILTYDVTASGQNILLRADSKPRIIPGERLSKECGGDLSKLKVVFFDRIGDFGKVKWKGLSPSALMVPAGIAYDRSADGYHIVGETTGAPISFANRSADVREIPIPVYIAVYEKKQNYKLVSAAASPWKISLAKSQPSPSQSGRAAVETERIAVTSSVEVEADNDDVIKAVAGMQMVRQMLETADEYPFPETLKMEIYNLRSLKERVRDPEVVGKINDVLLLCNDKERELKDSQREASIASQAQEQALLAQQKAEEETRLKEAEDKEREREEKQQKRTLWMIISGAILGAVAFVGNALFKNHRDKKNQKSIMDMQESLAKQAQHEATRRAREVVRNKAHQAVNKGKTRMRTAISERGKAEKGKQTKNPNIKSI